jgi:hypothetical protein
MLAAVCVVMGAGVCTHASGKTSQGIDQTVQYILNLVNTESGATRSLQSGEMRWTYSMALAGRCTLMLTEELQRMNSAVGSSPATPVREITHYLIPAANLNLGKFGTRLELDPPGVMQVIISTERATIRRWHGDPAVMPLDAPVAYEAPVRFGKPSVDIFDVTVRLENALKDLASLCRTQARPDKGTLCPRAPCYR